MYRNIYIQQAAKYIFLKNFIPSISIKLDIM